MRCNICDARLSPEEIEFERDFGRYAPCRRCIVASGVSLQSADPTDLEELEALLTSVYGEIQKGDDDQYSEPTEGEASLS